MVNEQASEKIVEAFLEPATYDGKVTSDIKLIQTHISWVFLTGKYAYKIKKPVDFGFLDFTTLEKRKKYSELELELNRRLCPGIYLNVLPVTQKDGKIKINGKGKTIEYVLKMKQLPQEKLMDKLLGRGRIGKETIDKIAKIVSEFHSKAATSNEISEFGSTEKIKFNWLENFRQTERFISDFITMDDFDFVKKEIENFLRNNESLFEKRVKSGKIRRIHGDLHTGNIFVIEGKPYIFDCIEFNMRFSCLDMAADVAFLSMDLDCRERKELSDFFVNKYVEYSSDYEILTLLNFYKCYYSWVRGKVTAFRLDEHLDVKTERLVLEKAKKYFKLALEYAKRL